MSCRISMRTPSYTPPQGRLELSVALARFARYEDLLISEDAPIDTEISGIAAPVFGPHGTILFAFELTGANYHARDVPVLSQAVLRAAGRVIAAIDGQHPPGATGGGCPGARRTLM
jgi:hypothetical protein